MTLLANTNALELDHVYMEKEEEEEEEQFDEKSSSNIGYVMNHNYSSSSSSSSHSSPSSSNNSSGFKFQASNYDHQEHSQYSLINFKYDDHHMMHSNGSFLNFGLNDHSVSNQYSSSALDVNQQWNNPQMVDISSFKTATSSINIIINRNIHDQSTTSQGVAHHHHHHHKRPHMDEHENSPKKQRIAKTSTSASKKSKPNTKDPQSIAAKNRRERISERLKVLQELVPNGSKVDMVTMLEKAISYVQFLQLQVKVLATDEFWPTQGGKSPDISQMIQIFCGRSNCRPNAKSWKAPCRIQREHLVMVVEVAANGGLDFKIGRDMHGVEEDEYVSATLTNWLSDFRIKNEITKTPSNQLVRRSIY
ncbi:hypothetical protein ACFE04_009371 [Oxalis oulophora]